MIDTPHDLLTAVDALTQPVRRKMVMDKHHEHDWLPILTPVIGVPVTTAKKVEWVAWAVRHGDLTPEEYQAWTKAELVTEFGKPEPIQSGWYCPHCDIKTNLPTHRPPAPVTVRRSDPSLLDQLEDAVITGSGQGAVRAQHSEQIEMDIAALELLEKIEDRFRAWLLEEGARPGKMTLRELLRSWYALHLARPDHDDMRARVLRGFAGEIREHLNPRIAGDIPGLCPRCRFAFVITDDDIRKRALQTREGATYDDTEASCLVCGHTWQGWAQLNELANGISRLAGEPELESPPLVG